MTSNISLRSTISFKVAHAASLGAGSVSSRTANRASVTRKDAASASRARRAAASAANCIEAFVANACALSAVRILLSRRLRCSRWRSSRLRSRSCSSDTSSILSSFRSRAKMPRCRACTFDAAAPRCLSMIAACAALRAATSASLARSSARSCRNTNVWLRANLPRCPACSLTLAVSSEALCCRICAIASAADLASAALLISSIAWAIELACARSKAPANALSLIRRVVKERNSFGLARPPPGNFGGEVASLLEVASPPTTSGGRASAAPAAATVPLLTT